MSEIIQIRLKNPNSYPENFSSSVKSIYLAVIERAGTQDFWDDSIRSIIVTDDLPREIDVQAQKWNIEAIVSREKESTVVSKTLFNHDLKNPEYCIFVHSGIFFLDSAEIQRQVYYPLINIRAKRILPENLRNFEWDYSPRSLKEYLEYVSSEWCTALWTRIYLSKLVTEISAPSHQKPFLDAFKRKLKKLLFEYNSGTNKEEGIRRFWLHYIASINTLFLRIVEFDTDKEEYFIDKNEPCRELLYNVVNEISNLTKSCISNEEFNVNSLKEAIKKFSAHFDVHLENEREQSFKIRLTRDPKDYFVKEIVETEPRIICYMDILGFSELIDEYDSDTTSTILQDIQESFALAKASLFENTNEKNKEAIKHLQYKTFSDNICISIPFFDNEQDFLANFNLITMYVRSVQYVLMTKGFFTRGGLSTGSYYSDENIIFSKGLVTAYLLESKKAIYPRVILDKELIAKLINYNKERVRYFGIDESIIFDWEHNAFLNPFGIMQSSIRMARSMFEELKPEEAADPLEKQLYSLTKKLGEMSIDLLKSAHEEEKKSIVVVKEKIAQNFHKHRENEHIYSKYLWLWEFLLWLENDTTGRLKFYTLSEMLP
ncbi:MAG: hypothetical protein IT233_12725 [Bacteroidia bacterium]|nr:hypothetical protein [Bacteroidia bacterium]